jgi:hypothetical protein
MNPIARRALGILAATGLVGLSVFSVLVYRAVDIETAGAEDAARRFAAVRATLPPGRPVLTLDDAGNVLRREVRGRNSRNPVRRLCVLAYFAAGNRIVSATVPLWFFRIKRPAAQFALRDTGLDLDRLGITPSDLQGYGPIVLIDHARSGRDLLLVWTE